MRFRQILLTLLIGGTFVAVVGCSGKPENSPAIRKKFAEMDQMKKSVDEMSSEMQFMSAEIRRLSQENSDLRALAPDMDGAAPAIEKIGEIEKRLSQVESMARDGVLANSQRPASSSNSSRTQEVADAGASARRPIDLENATLAGGNASSNKRTETVAAQQQATKPAAAEKPRRTETTTKKPATKTASTSSARRGSYHTIESGETIDTIAKKYNTSESVILKANRLPKGNRLAKGQRLYIPGK